MKIDLLSWNDRRSVVRVHSFRGVNGVLGMVQKVEGTLNTSNKLCRRLPFGEMKIDNETEKDLTYLAVFLLRCEAASFGRWRLASAFGY